MLPDIDFSKLTNAMFTDSPTWRELDGQIRAMNKRLAQWRRARLDRGATYSLTQRTAFEVLVTMQAIYGTVEKPRAIASAIDPPPRPDVPPQLAASEFDGLRAADDGIVEAGMLYVTDDPIIAASDDTGIEVIHVSAAA